MNDSTSLDDEHDGISLWRKYADIKRYVINQITPFYVKCLGKDGLIPSRTEVRDFVENASAAVPV